MCPNSQPQEQQRYPSSHGMTVSELQSGQCITPPSIGSRRSRSSKSEKRFRQSACRPCFRQQLPRLLRREFPESLRSVCRFPDRLMSLSGGLVLLNARAQGAAEFPKNFSVCPYETEKVVREFSALVRDNRDGPFATPLRAVRKGREGKMVGDNCTSSSTGNPWRARPVF